VNMNFLYFPGRTETERSTPPGCGVAFSHREGSVQLLHCALAAAQGIVIGNVCLCVFVGVLPR